MLQRKYAYLVVHIFSVWIPWLNRQMKYEFVSHEEFKIWDQTKKVWELFHSSEEKIDKMRKIATAENTQTPYVCKTLTFYLLLCSGGGMGTSSVLWPGSCKRMVHPCFRMLLVLALCNYPWIIFPSQPRFA